MAYITDRPALFKYVKRTLGDGVIDINVSDDQIMDRFDDALEFFREYYFDGVERVYLKHQLTQNDLDNNYIDLPECIYGVIRVFPFTGSSSSRNLFDLQYQLRLNDLYDLTSTSIIYYAQVMEYLSLLDFELNGQKQIRFNRMNGRLYIDEKIQQYITIDQYLIVESYRALDPEDNKRLYNEIRFRRYMTALVKRQWGNNLKKFGGIQLPGGVFLEGKPIYDEAVMEIQQIEQDMINNQAPCDAIIG